MGNFLIVVPAENAAPEGKQLFFAGLEAARHLGWQRPGAIVENDWAFAAAFPRHNGSGGKLETDPATGSWILTSGVWFHRDSFGSGSESRLLRRILEVDVSQLCHELEGFFVIAFGDARRREVVLITDVIGSRHCFKRNHGPATLLSGSSLLLASVVDSQLDCVGAQEFLNAGIVFEDRTCYREVKKIGPASVVRLSAGAEKSQQYWNPADVCAQHTKGSRAVEAVWHSSCRAASRIHQVYPNSVADLTGGYDSRTVVASLLGSGVHCATTVSGPKGNADVEISTGLAENLGLAHMRKENAEAYSFSELETCVSLTDGEYDVLKYAQIHRCHTELASRFDLSINGSFGEIARGYWWELLLPAVGARKPLDASKLAKRRYGAQRFDAALVPSGTRLDLIAHLTEVIERTNAGLNHLPNTFQMDHTYLKMRMQRWQGRIASSTNQIWPCISPFMFRSVLEAMLQAAPILRWRSLLVRKMLARFAPQIAAYPLEHGFPAEPANWKNFYKFAPLAPHLVKKCLAAAQSLPIPRRRNPGNTGSCPRPDLWKDERIRELFYAPDMKAGVLLDQPALKNFLERSQQVSFAFEEQWARLLTLEWGLRIAGRTRKAAMPLNLLAANRA